MLNMYSCWNICAEHDDTSCNRGARGGGAARGGYGGGETQPLSLGLEPRGGPPTFRVPQPLCPPPSSRLAPLPCPSSPGVTRGGAGAAKTPCLTGGIKAIEGLEGEIFAQEI